MRLDYFLIWGHGLIFFEDIVEDISANNSFEILHLQKNEIEDLDWFLDQIYSHEWPCVPAAHTKSKTAFLYHVPKEIGLILVLNKDPQERVQDNKDARFRMPESKSIKDMKTLIRQKYDPNKGGSSEIALIPGYNPDQHVVHASDFESQTKSIMKLFGLKTEEEWMHYYQNKVAKKITANSQIIDINIDDIIIKLFDIEKQKEFKFYKIQDTPHFKFLSGDPDKYNFYWRQYCGIYLVEDHSTTNFRKLAMNFNYLEPPHENNYINVRKTNDNYLSMDGDHRLAILKYQNHKNIKVNLI